MNYKNFLSYENLIREPHNVFGDLYKDPIFVKTIRQIEKIIRDTYSLYKDECRIKITNEDEKWTDYIIAHFKHHNFCVYFEVYDDYKLLIFDLNKSNIFK